MSTRHVWEKYDTQKRTTSTTAGVIYPNDPEAVYTADNGRLSGAGTFYYVEFTFWDEANGSKFLPTGVRDIQTISGDTTISIPQSGNFLFCKDLNNLDSGFPIGCSFYDNSNELEQISIVSGYKISVQDRSLKRRSSKNYYTKGGYISNVTAAASNAYPENGAGGGNYQLITFVPMLVAAMARKGVA